MFRSPAFRAANLLTLLLYFGVTAVFFVLPFNLVQVQGYSATLTGAAYLPFGMIARRPLALGRQAGGSNRGEAAPRGLDR